MRSSVDAAAFYKAMTALMEVTSKSSIEVLREIKVEFTADHCTLSATNFNTWLSVTIPASGDDFAFVFWNSAGVQKVCRYFTGQLELELSGQRKSQIITMRCGDKGGKFPVYEAEECPTWPEFEAKQSYTANAANILKCVKQVKYAVDLRSTRPEYQGVLFQNKHIWAVEGHRAACCDDGGLDVETPFLVGVPALEQIKVFGAADIQISVADNWVLFQNEHVRLLAKRMLIDSYPAEKISFFSNLMVSKKVELLSELSNNVIFKRVLTNDNYRKELYSQYRTMESNISWELVLRESLDKT